MKKKVLVLLLIAAMILSLAACAKTQETSKPAETQQTTEPAKEEVGKASDKVEGVNVEEKVEEGKKYKEHVNLSVWANASSADPAIYNGTPATVIYNLFRNQLINLNEEENVFEPELAESWEVTDLRTAKFTLKQGIKFHNGEEVTSEDVKYSLLDRPATVEGATVNFFKKIDNIEIVDKYNFIIHLNQNDPEMLYTLKDSGYSILNKKACEESEDGYLIGTGGYKVISWAPGDKMELEKFDESYVWAEEGDTPTRSITMKCMVEGSIAAVQAGEVANALCEREDVENYLSSDPNVVTHTFRTWGIWMIGLNQHEGSVFHDDPNLKYAVVHAFDREMMAEFYAGQNAKTFDSFFPEYMYGYTNEFEFAKFDLDLAKDYLSKSKHPDGNVTIRVLTHSNPNYTPQVTVLQSILEGNLGVKIDITQLDSAGRNAALAEGTSYDIYMMDITGAPYGSRLQNRFIEGNNNNWVHYTNEEINQCYETYFQSEDEAEKLAALRRVQEIEAEELVYVPYAYMVTNVVMAKGVSGLNWKTSTQFDFHRVVWEED